MQTLDELHKKICIRPETWTGCFVASESTLHQLSPYIGKVKSAMASELITQLTEPGQTIVDPFAGSGTVALQAWILGRNAVANDLSPYALLLLRAKLDAPPSLDEAMAKISKYSKRVDALASAQSLDIIPLHVRQFFHHQTLREALSWRDVLVAKREWFILACLMGILHHQRPGFLSFPSSHAVPYLRTAKFPIDGYPLLYEYRSVRERLERKVVRALSRVPNLDTNLRRFIQSIDARRLRFGGQVHAVITSPPYMRRLSYARDNRLRLWFLGVEAPDPLDRILSPKPDEFLGLMQVCLLRWHHSLTDGGYCALVVGDEVLPSGRGRLPDVLRQMATEGNIGFRLADTQSNGIPAERRVRRHASGSKSETILVFQKVRPPALF